MNEMAIEIQKVMNTLQDLNMKPTFDNVHIMSACMDVLATVRDKLMGIGQQQTVHTSPAPEPENEQIEESIEAEVEEINS